MPAYNEADGIAEFIREIANRFSDCDHRVIVVDDSSSDGTSQIVSELGTKGRVTAVRSEVNCGHGPTTMKAMRLGLEQATDFIVTVDGDGQFFGADIRRVFDIAVASGCDIVEGVRTGRGDPIFRRITSAATRGLVRVRSGSWPRDANTPLRVYRAGALGRMLSVLSETSMTPNLEVSALTRRWGLDFLEIPVKARDRRGSTAAGTTWGQRKKSLPTKRFLRFCVDSILQWFGIAEQAKKG